MKWLAAAVTMALVLAGLGWVLWSSQVPATPPAPPPPERDPAPAAASSTQSTPVPSTPQRDPVATAEPTFRSESDDDGVIADPVRDGVAVLVLGLDRLPRAGAPIDVRWRKGWGMYGHDRGLADARGRFATTVAESVMLECVKVTDPEFGELSNWSAMLPMADDPRTVLCVVPSMQPLTVRVVDQRGRVVPGAKVTFACDRSGLAPREYVLGPDETERTVGVDGQVLIPMPSGPATLRAEADGFDPLYELATEVPVGGRAVTLHLFDRAALRDVPVTVIGPEDLLPKVRLSGYSRELPDLPGLAGDGIEPLQRQFEARRVDGGAGDRARFVVAAPPGPWRCSARAERSYGGAKVAPFATAVTIELQPPPARPPMAQLRIKLLLPDGQETHGEVMVHTTPDLIYGPRRTVSSRSPLLEVEPGVTACVSAWRYRYPPALVGPIELKAGEQEVVLQFTTPSRIAGRVVDERGEPVRASVNLLRPAGPLRALAADVPSILPHAANGDQLGTHDDGAFHFDAVGAGRHALLVVPRATGWPARVEVMPGQQDVVVRLGEGIDDLARIQGRVTRSDTGEPVAGAQLHWRSENDGHTVYSDRDGRFALALPPATIALEAHARRCAWLAADAEPFARGLNTRDVVLEPSEPLFVLVRDAEGRVPDVEISAFDDRGRELSFLDHNGNHDGGVLSVDANGRAELGGLPFATLRLHLWLDGDESQAMDVEVPATTPRDRNFEIVWRPGGR